ncbi:hypothetical protein V8G54_016058 [Vigna mungo]|uniref:Uncharacterized protein n=1 Tax=Vigna mungo TaxID=3915 RepID=A0AAQ3NND0_VIGMU
MEVHYHSCGLWLNQNYVVLAKFALGYLTPGLAMRLRSGNQVFQQFYRFASIHGLILYSEPYYNELGFAHLMGSKEAYIDGAQVGCLTKGGCRMLIKGTRAVQISLSLLSALVDMLIREFMKIGAKNCDKVCPSANLSQPQVTLWRKLLMDVGVIARILSDLQVYHYPAKVKCLLLPTKLFGRRNGKKASKADESSPSLMNWLMGDQVLEQVLIQGQKGSIEATMWEVVATIKD